MSLKACELLRRAGGGGALLELKSCFSQEYYLAQSCGGGGVGLLEVKWAVLVALGRPAV